MISSWLLYRFGPSSKQKVNVSDASSSKNSVANASHQQLSLSWNQNIKFENKKKYLFNAFMQYNFDNISSVLPQYVVANVY